MVPTKDGTGRARFRVIWEGVKGRGFPMKNASGKGETPGIKGGMRDYIVGGTDSSHEARAEQRSAC